MLHIHPHIGLLRPSLRARGRAILCAARLPCRVVSSRLVRDGDAAREKTSPFDSGQIYISTFSDWGGGALFANPLALQSLTADGVSVSTRPRLSSSSSALTSSDGASLHPTVSRSRVLLSPSCLQGNRLRGLSLLCSSSHAHVCLRSLRAVVSHRPRVLVSEWAVLRLQRWRRRSSCQLQLLIVRDMR
jgi:hypothetical protein